MIYKRRYVPVVRDFPEGCGVFSGHRSNAGDSLMQTKFKRRRTVQSRRDFPDFSKIKEESSDHSETGISGIEELELDNTIDVTKDEQILESCGGFKDHLEKEVIGDSDNTQNQDLECSTKVRKTSSEKKRRLSVHNSTMEVETNVVHTSKRVIVSGLAAKSKCPWRQPKKRGSRRVKD